MLSPGLRPPGDADPTDPAVRRAHGETARAHGVYAFCYRWADDDEVLARILAEGVPDLPFVLRIDARADVERVARALDAPRCVRVEGRPMVLVEGGGVAAALRARREVHVVGVLGGRPGDDALGEWDAVCEEQPAYVSRFGLPVCMLDGSQVVSAEHAWRSAASLPRLHPVRYRGLFVGRDEGARGVRYIAPSPASFRRFVASCNADGDTDPVVFVDGWNGWREGCALAPCAVHGTAMLEALRDGQGERAPALPLTVEPPLHPIDPASLLVMRVGALTPTWDATAAGLALRGGVAVVDCDPHHHHVSWLARHADVLVLAALDDGLLDLVAGRVEAGRPTYLDEAAIARAAEAGVQARLVADLLPLARGMASAGDPLQALEGRLPSPRPSLPPLGRLSPGASRYLAPLTSVQRALEEARGLPPAEGAAAVGELLAEHPRYIQAWRLRLQLLNDAGQSRQVRAEAADILAAAPFQSRVRAELGRALFREGRVDEAFDALRRAVATNPGQVTAWAYLLRLAAHVRHPDLEDLVARVCDFHPANYGLGLVAAEAVPLQARMAFVVGLLERVARTARDDEQPDLEQAFGPALRAIVEAGGATTSARSWLGRACRLLPACGEVAALRARFVPGAPPPTPPPFGVNLSGPLRSMTGLGAGARAVAKALAAAGIPHVLDNWAGEWAASVVSDDMTFSGDHPFSINVIHANANEMATWRRRRGSRMAGRRNVAIWNWELERFPDAWREQFEGLDEVWTPSRFTQAVVAAASPVPVHVVPYPVVPPGAVPRGFTRALLGIPEAAFAFLFAFDFYSQVARKNPAAVVQAFREACGARRDACLVVKCLHHEYAPAALQRLVDEARGLATVRFLLTPLTRPEMDGLLRLCDAFVSLHRSEGFGLPIHEAMAAGKPVIATGYSGNVDHMTDENSMAVRWRRIEIDRDQGPYAAGAWWAEPDLDHAAVCMRALVDDRVLAARLGERARADMARTLSLEAVGALLAARLRGEARTE